MIGKKPPRIQSRSDYLLETTAIPTGSKSRERNDPYTVENCAQLHESGPGPVLSFAAPFPRVLHARRNRATGERLREPPPSTSRSGSGWRSSSGCNGSGSGRCGIIRFSARVGGSASFPLPHVAREERLYGAEGQRLLYESIRAKGARDGGPSSCVGHKRSIGTLCCALTVHSLMAERAFSRVYAERLILCTLVICTRDLS